MIDYDHCRHTGNDRLQLSDVTFHYKRIFCVIFLFILMKSNRIRALMVRSPPFSILCQIILLSFFFHKFYLLIFFYLFSIFHKNRSSFLFLCRGSLYRKYGPFVGERMNIICNSEPLYENAAEKKKERERFEKMLLNRVKHFPQHYVMKTTLTNPTVNFRHTLMYLINKKHFSKTLCPG